jgi:hypothetical protein
MRRRKGFVTLALCALSWSACPAATLLRSDFAQGIEGWDRRGNSRLAPTADAGRSQVLQLTTGANNQAGIAWTEMRRRVPSFSFIVEARIRFTRRNASDCPADGFALVFAPVETDMIGSSGSALALCDNEFEIRQFVAMELNTWSGQGLGSDAERASCSAGKNETFAFDVLTPSLKRTAAARTTGGGTPAKGGFKIGQTLPPPGVKIVNGGWYRYQWNVAPDGTMTLYLTGLEASNQQFQKVKVLEVTMGWNPLDTFDGRWGLAAGTGGLTQTCEVSRVTIEAPMVGPQ